MHRNYSDSVDEPFMLDSELLPQNKMAWRRIARKREEKKSAVRRDRRQGSSRGFWSCTREVAAACFLAWRTVVAQLSAVNGRMLDQGRCLLAQCFRSTPYYRPGLGDFCCIVAPVLCVSGWPVERQKGGGGKKKEKARDDDRPNRQKIKGQGRRRSYCYYGRDVSRRVEVTKG